MSPANCKSRSRGQVDVDALIAYLLFIFFIIFAVNFLIRLISPFIDVSEFEIREKRITAVLSQLEEYSITPEEFRAMCTQDFDFVNNLSLEYNVMGFVLPQKANHSFTEWGEGQVRIMINNHDLNVSVGRDSGSGNASFSLVFPEEVFVSAENTTDSDDSFTNSTDFYGNKVYSFNLTVPEGDVDNFTLTATNSQPFMVMLTSINTTQGFDLSKYYVGELCLNVSCGTTGSSEEEYAYQEFFTNVMENGEKYLSKVRVNAWIK